MKYQKEFEERFIDAYDDDFQGVNPKTGRYYDPEDQALYEGFVAGIESGLKKKEPTLLELVGEWRKSDITDAILLNKISHELDKFPWQLINHSQLTKCNLPDYKYIDLADDIGRICTRYNVKDNPITTLDRMRKMKHWRPSAVQD